MLSSNDALTSAKRNIRKLDMMECNPYETLPKVTEIKNEKGGQKPKIFDKQQRTEELSKLYSQLLTVNADSRNAKKKIYGKKTKKRNETKNRNSLFSLEYTGECAKDRTGSTAVADILRRKKTNGVSQSMLGGGNNCIHRMSKINVFDPDEKNASGFTTRSKLNTERRKEGKNRKFRLSKISPSSQMENSVEYCSDGKKGLMSTAGADEMLTLDGAKSNMSPTSVQSKKELFEKQISQKRGGSVSPYTSPVKKHSGISDGILVTPKTLERGFVDLNVSAPSLSKLSNNKSPKPPKRFMDTSQHEKGRLQGFIDASVTLLSDKSKESEVRALVYRIDDTGGFPVTRRLSLRDNELVGKMVMAIRNDPMIKSIEVSSDLFGKISSTLLEQFVRSLRINLHLKSITFSGVELGNDFLYSLASSMESNFILEEIDLSRNLFTNAGLAEFCQIIATSNETCKILNLENQTTPISKASEAHVLDAFQQNKTIQEIKLDFQSAEAALRLADIINRNKREPVLERRNDEKLLGVLRNEAERAKELFEENQGGDSALHISEKDWDHLYDLSVQFDVHKLEKHIQQTTDELAPRKNCDLMTKEEKKDFLFGEFRKNLGDSISCFGSDGSFLTAEFISTYFVEGTESRSLAFDFHGQWKLFRRFPLHDPARQLIVEKFVNALVTHPRADKITAINMANTGCGDDFLVCLANRCLADVSLLPSLLMLNFETNFINADGIVALAKTIESAKCLKFLQVVRLENQKFLLKSRAELALAKAMRLNFSIVVMSLRIRNLMERQQISKYVLRNVEFIRQARQRHFKAIGKQRERNAVEKFFDKIADNDDSIVEVDLIGNKRFLTLAPEEKRKAATSFAMNTNVKSIILNSCGIDDEFVINFASSLKKNNTISKIHLEGNEISGVGITALFSALAENSSVEELRLHKQSKTMNTSEEHTLADILRPNTTVTKLGIDLRTKMSEVQLDKKLALNRNKSLKLRAESKGETFQPSEIFSSLIKF